MNSNVIVVVAGWLGSNHRGGDTAAPAVDDRKDVERVRADDSEGKRSLELRVTTTFVGAVLNVAVAILAGDEEVLGRSDLAVPRHTSDLGGIVGGTGEELGRRAGFDAAIVGAADVPRPLELGDVELGVIGIGLGPVVVRSVDVGLARFRVGEGRDEVGVELGAKRILLHLHTNLAPEIATIRLVDDVHVDRAVLLEPWIVDPLIPRRRRRDQTETLV